jgi:hypothetical protein
MQLALQAGQKVAPLAKRFDVSSQPSLRIGDALRLDPVPSPEAS